MELTKEQIQQVEIYLDKKRFDFIDLRIEVLDHMISEIEMNMSKSFSFEDAFKMTVLKWNKHFEETFSFYFGMIYTDSKIVVKKAVKVFRAYFVIYLTSYFLPFVFLTLVPIKVSVNFADFVNGFILSSSFFAIFYILFIAFKIRKQAINTTYRFILKTQYAGVILLILGAFLGKIFNNNGDMKPVFTGFVSAGFSAVFICHHFYQKHKEAIKKHQIS